jgi:hypothetical protein
MQIAHYDDFSFYTDDPVFLHSISNGYTEPYPLHLDIVKRYLSIFPHKNRTYIDIGAHIGTTILMTIHLSFLIILIFRTCTATKYFEYI